MARWSAAMKAIGRRAGELLEGAGLLGRGFGFLGRHPELYKYVFWPVIINLLVFCLSVVAAFSFVPGWLLPRIPRWEGWLGYLYYVAVVAGGVLLLVICYALVFLLVGRLLAAAFYSRMAVRTLHLTRGTPPQPPRGFVAEVLLPVLNTVKRLALVLPFLILSFLPILGEVIGVVVASFFIASELLDFPLDTIAPPIRFRDRLRYVWEHRWRMLGLGGASALLLLIPMVGCLVAPLGVLGATLHFSERAQGLPTGAELQV